MPTSVTSPPRTRRSNLSPYLHFGHISSLEVALTADQPEFREELIVRRELAFNFARHARFDSLDSLPDWAKHSLRDHARDPRPAAFTLSRSRTRRDVRPALERHTEGIAAAGARSMATTGCTGAKS